MSIPVCLQSLPLSISMAQPSFTRNPDWKSDFGMPKGPKGQKRPADVIGNAVKVMRIATGEENEDTSADDGKDTAAVSLGRKGGKARAEALSKKQRAEIAKKAAQARWKA